MAPQVIAVEMSNTGSSSQTMVLKNSRNSELVKLNVGGKIFETTDETLRRITNSKLDLMLNSSNLLDQEGRLFIDRSSVHFEYILNFLRDGTFPPVTLSLAEKEMIYREALYYDLEELTNWATREIGGGVKRLNHSSINMILNSAKCLDGNDMRFMDLQGFNLCGVTARKCNFWEANLQDIDLTDSDFSWSIFEGANFKGEEGVDSIFGAGFKTKSHRPCFFQANLKTADLSNIFLEDGIFEFSDLSMAQILNSNFQGANFGKANLTQSNFEGSKLDCACFKGALLIKSSFKKASLRKANFEYSDLRTCS
mmetsp:Transcript_996/g.1291  ORF Transcript_996/g.1291 Transcript_996/m.1291 type:complete len:310 (+) Transcript_996:247-1176(+)